MRDDAYRAIDDVLADPDLQSNYDNAKRLRGEVADCWKSIENMAKNAMRGRNHPLVSFMALKGIEEHKNYQRNTSNCHAYEIETGRRRAELPARGRGHLLRRRAQAEQLPGDQQGKAA